MAEYKRKLVSVQKLINITPIENADNIMKANVLGWQVIIPKNQYNENEDICFFEIDSFIPQIEGNTDFEFLRPSCYKQYGDGRKGFRIRTKKLRGVFSQGLVMPLSILPRDRYVIGQDVSKLLGVYKYEPPMPKCLSGNAKGTFPTFLIKTDETRVQLLGEVIDRHEGLACYISEKVDGSSVSYYLKDDMFGVCSRNIELKIDEENKTGNAYVKWAIENNVEQRMRDFAEESGLTDFAIQGEIYGKNISGNRLKQGIVDVIFFNVFNIKTCQYQNFTDFVFSIMDMGFKTVPIINTFYRLERDVNKILDMATGKSIINSDCMREGIVIRPLEEKMDMGMCVGGFGATGRLSFKAVSPQYLLKSEMEDDE